MPSYLRFTPPPLEVSSVRPRLTVLVALGCLACGGAGPGKLAPQSPQETLAQFMSAVKANDLERSEEHTSELQSQSNLVCRLLLEKKKQCRKVGTTTALTSSGVAKSRPSNAALALTACVRRTSPRALAPIISSGALRVDLADCTE